MVYFFESTDHGIGFTTIPHEVHGTLGGAEVVLWDVSRYSAIDVFRLPDEYRGSRMQPSDLSSVLHDIVGSEWGKYYPQVSNLLEAAATPEVFIPF